MGALPLHPWPGFASGLGGLCLSQHGLCLSALWGALPHPVGALPHHCAGFASAHFLFDRISVKTNFGQNQVQIEGITMRWVPHFGRHISGSTGQLIPRLGAF